MINNLIKILLISFSLVLRPDCAFAKDDQPAVDAKLNTLLQGHEDIISGQMAQETIARQGKFLANETLKYVNDPKNKAQLNTPQGKNLLKHQALLMNYLTVKDYLEKCTKNQSSKRDLKNRILNSALQGLSKSNDPSTPCYNPKSNTKNLVDFNNNVMKAMKASIAGDFLNELSKKTLINSMKSLIGLKYKFDPKFMAQGYLTQAELNTLSSLICYKNSCQKLGSQFKNELANEAINYAKSMKNSGPRFNNDTAAKSINQSIDRLNSALAKINVKKDEGIIFDSANLSDPNSKKQFDQYVYTYMNEVASNAGPLLLTQTMREKSGEIKSFDADSTMKDKKTAQFKFIRHEYVNAEDVKNANDEATKKILESTRDYEKIISRENLRATNPRYAIYNNRKEDINELVKINPFAVGQALIKNPEYSGLACDAIKEIESKDKRDAKFDQYFVIGSAILGGALLLTGVGTMVGAYMITGSVTAGIAAGTVGGTILSSTIVAGAVSETASAAYFGKKSYDAYTENAQIEKAIFTNNGDNVSIIEKRDAYLSFKEERMKSMLSLAGVALQGVRLEKFFEIGRLTAGGLKLNEMRASTKIMEYLNDSKVANKLATTVKLFGSKGSDMLDDFLLKLAKVGEKTRIATLELLKDSKITPQKLKEIMEEALEAAKKCIKA